MWFIEDYEIRNIQLDFTSSTGERPRSCSVFTGDVQLVNAADFADLTSDPTQVHVCEHCGVVGCADGGYVRFRRVSDFCIWLPDFPSMLSAGWEAQQVAPPTYIEDRGIPVVNRTVYSKLETEMGQFPPFDELRRHESTDTCIMCGGMTRSPDGRHEAELIYAGEIPFGPQYFNLRIDERSFGSRLFGYGFLWSPDSSMVVLTEWHTSDREKPR
jgi:hypothetical protein